MPRLRSPVSWYGGKGHMVAKLLPYIPPHHTYVEPFGGGASLLFAKDPSPVEVYNDIDARLVNFFHVLRDPQKFARFYRMAVLTPYSREEYNDCRANYDRIEDEVEKAWAFFVLARQSFSGAVGRSWSFAVRGSRGSAPISTRRWLSILGDLPQIHRRLLKVKIECLDFRRVFEIYDGEETFFYCDPPYVPETRRTMNVYQHEMTLADHEDLVRLLLSIKGMAMLSGYRHEVYRPLEEAGWKRVDFFVVCHAAARTRQTGLIGPGVALARQLRVESLWLCPRTQERLGRVPKALL